MWKLRGGSRKPEITGEGGDRSGTEGGETDTMSIKIPSKESKRGGERTCLRTSEAKKKSSACKIEAGSISSGRRGLPYGREMRGGKFFERTVSVGRVKGGRTGKRG